MRISSLFDQLRIVPLKNNNLNGRKFKALRFVCHLTQDSPLDLQSTTVMAPLSVVSLEWTPLIDP